MAQEIVGRTAEKRDLEEAYASRQAEFIAVYGRRRVGKTFLVVNTFQPHKGLYFQTTGIKDGTRSVQLERFAEELGKAFYPGASMKVPGDWMEAFDALSEAIGRQPKSRKIVLFFDELPWMATRRSRLLQALEYFWNRYWFNDPRIRLVVCGSSASWIMRKIIKNRGGLHNRVTLRLNLKPFDLRQTHEFLKWMGYPASREQALRIFMAVGGVPFYLKQFRRNHSVDQNISYLLFTPDGLLFNEFDEIFSSLFDEAEHYQELLVLIAERREGLFRQEIEARNKLTGKGGRLSKRLEDLETAGFIVSQHSFGKASRGTLYRLSDEYCYFYLDWIAPVKAQLKTDTGANYWRSSLKTSKYHTWQGYAFENVCFKHLTQIRSTLGIMGFAPASTWRYVLPRGSVEEGAQIDLLFDRDDDAITLCEIKYSEKPFVIDKRCAKSLVYKRECFIHRTRTKKQVFTALITPHGVADNLYADELTGGTVALGDLF